MLATNAILSPSANILPPQATPGVLHLLSARVPGFVPSELPGVGPIYYHKCQVVSEGTFQLQTDVSDLLLLSSHKICFKPGGKL